MARPPSKTKVVKGERQHDFLQVPAWLQSGADSTLGLCIRRQQIEQQLFIGSHNETLSVSGMCVSNPDCSPVRITSVLAASYGAPKRFHFLNAEKFGTICAVQSFNRFPLSAAGNRLQDAI